MSNQYVFTKEHNLTVTYKKAIQPFWQNEVTQGDFQGVKNVKIAYAFIKHPQPIGSIVISSGRIESMLKYKEVVFDLFQNGYSVFIHDHRGQGLSGRMLENKQMGYVDDFFDYVADFKAFMDQVVLLHSQHRPNLLCHSMGGAIGALTILRYPTLFKNVAFSAPMFGIRPALPDWFANILLNLHDSLNQQVAYFFGQKDYERHPFENNNLSHSQIRYYLFREEYQYSPEVQLGGVTGHWLRAARQAMEEIEQRAAEFPIPGLALQAGSDTIVDNTRQTRVVRNMPNTRLNVIAGAKHELLEEQDQYRVPCLTEILGFFAE